MALHTATGVEHATRAIYRHLLQPTNARAGLLHLLFHTFHAETIPIPGLWLGKWKRKALPARNVDVRPTSLPCSPSSTCPRDGSVG